VLPDRDQLGGQIGGDGVVEVGTRG